MGFLDSITKKAKGVAKSVSKSVTKAVKKTTKITPKSFQEQLGGALGALSKGGFEELGKYASDQAARGITNIGRETVKNLKAEAKNQVNKTVASIAGKMTPASRASAPAPKTAAGKAVSKTPLAASKGVTAAKSDTSSLVRAAMPAEASKSDKAGMTRAEWKVYASRKETVGGLL